MGDTENTTWIISPASPDRDEAARRWGVPPLVAQLMLNRGVSAHGNGDTFLSPQLRDLQPPSCLPGTEQAAGIICQSIREGGRIAIYGDYDVDGIMATAILWHTLRLAGADVVYYIPHRIDEGYGINLAAVRKLADEGVRTLISVDCGITAVDVGAWAEANGLRLVLTDHHAPQANLPQADAIVHPLLGGNAQCAGLCGAGIAYKVAWAIAQQLSGAVRVAAEFRDLLLELLPLAALGTIADVVPLTDENRIIARHGLERLSRTRLAGLRALLDCTGLSRARVDGYDVGFKLAPRINAAGRMGHARLAAELLTVAGESRAREIALYLEDHNRSRQSVERQLFKEVCAVVERDGLAGDTRRALVLAGDGWHAGVVGIVAARVVETYHRPTVLIALGDDEGQGSGRSIRHFDLAGALAHCQEHLITFGGHAMAAGLRIRRENVEKFRDAFCILANNLLTGVDLVPRLRLDAEVRLAEMTLPTAEAIQRLGPFGTGNQKPKLATAWVELADEPRTVGRNSEHLQAHFRDNGSSLKAIGFGFGKRVQDLKERRRCRIAFEPIVNEYQGHRTVEMQVLDMQIECGTQCTA